MDNKSLLWPLGEEYDRSPVQYMYRIKVGDMNKEKNIWDKSRCNGVL